MSEECPDCRGLLFVECQGYSGDPCEILKGEGGECAACSNSGLVDCARCTLGRVCSSCGGPTHHVVLESGVWGKELKTLVRTIRCVKCGWLCSE